MDLLKKTIISPCNQYRYTLWRQWDTGEGYVNFIGLNPSTADATKDDPTIRRCIAFAKAWGYAGLCMTNLFAFRTKDPKEMKAFQYPNGPENNKHLITCGRNAGLIVAAWGTHGTFLYRDTEVKKLFPELYTLRQTKDGHPSHPLYLPKNLIPVKML